METISHKQWIESSSIAPLQDPMRPSARETPQCLSALDETKSVEDRYDFLVPKIGMIGKSHEKSWSKYL